MSATRRSKQPVDEVLDLLGIARLGQRGEADEVGEQHRDDPALVARAAAGPARTTSRTGRRPVPWPPHAGQVIGRSIRASDAVPRSTFGPFAMVSRDATAAPSLDESGPSPSRSLHEHVSHHRPPPAPPRRPRGVDAVKVYGSGDTEVRALDGVTVDFDSGRFTAIMGPSGSGKSTLMHCVAGLDTLTSGRVLIGDTDLSTARRQGSSPQLRRDQIGFVFQAFNLVPTLDRRSRTSRCPMDLAGRKPDKAWLDHGRRHRRPRRPPARTARASSPAASSSASRWPGRWPAGPRSSSPTSPPATSTRGPAPRSSTFMRKAVRRARPDHRDGHPRPVAAGYADRVLFLADGRIVDEMLEPDRRAASSTA